MVSEGNRTDKRLSEYLTQVILYSTAVILAAQMRYSFFSGGFLISAGIVPLAVFMFLSDSFPFFPVLFLSAAGIYGTRVLSFFMQYGTTSGLVSRYGPEFVFYFIYGLLLYIYCRIIRKDLSHGMLFLPLLVPDYLANLTELFLRTANVLTAKMQLGIITAAAVRTLLIWILITRFRELNFALLRKEHARRYEKLLLLTSRLQSETLWMNKNTEQIESTMTSSYHLFNVMKADGAKQEYIREALGIATEIHEIKKENHLVIRGIREALADTQEPDSMLLHDIFIILEDALKSECESYGKHLHMDVSLKDDPSTNKYYALISVFRNLIANSVEASAADDVKVLIRQEPAGSGFLAISVSDFGPGIPAADLSDIFNAGFSTKINYETGAVSRGLGLTIVKDIVEKELGGSITVRSDEKGTVFTVEMKKSILEVEHEDLPDR